MSKDGLTEREQNDLREVGVRIRTVREGRNMTQKDLAGVIEKDKGKRKSANEVSRYELGNRQMRVTTFFSFAESLQVTPNDICPQRLLSFSAIQVQSFSELTRDDQEMLSEFARIMKERRKGKD